MFGGWFCQGRYEPALRWASPEGAQPGGIFRSRHEGAAGISGGRRARGSGRVAAPG